MKLSSRHRIKPEFEMSSMTDIIFLLLIFFVLTSGITTSGLRPKLPSSDETVIESEKVSVAIMKDNRIFFGETETDLSQLEAQIRAKLNANPDSKKNNTIVIKGDVEAKFGTVVDVYNITKKIENATSVIAFDPVKQ